MSSVSLMCINTADMCLTNAESTAWDLMAVQFVRTYAISHYILVSSALTYAVASGLMPGSSFIYLPLSGDI